MDGIDEASRIAARCARQGPESIRGHDLSAARRRREAEDLRSQGQADKAAEKDGLADQALRSADHLRRRHADALRTAHPQVGAHLMADRVEATYRSTWEGGRVVETPAIVSRASGFVIDVTPARIDAADLGMLMAECVVLPGGRELEIAMTADGQRRVANFTALWPTLPEPAA